MDNVDAHSLFDDDDDDTSQSLSWLPDVPDMESRSAAPRPWLGLFTVIAVVGVCGGVCYAGWSVLIS